MTAIIKAGAAYFALGFLAGFLMGAIRVPLLVPRLGVRMAELIEMPFMLVAIYFCARWTVRRFALAPGASQRLPVGLFALALLLCAEFTLVLGLQGLSLAGYLEQRDPVSGAVYLAMLGIFAVLPVFVGGREKRAS